jgi:opacity protein-like surface antigen
MAFADESGFYIGAGLGAYTIDVDDTDFDDGDNVARALVGYQFGENLAIEADYQKLYAVEDDVLGIEAELEADAWGVAIRPMVELTDFIDLYGKVGYTWYDVDARAEIFGVPITESDSDSALTYGGGVDLNFGNLSLRGEVSKIDIDDADLNLVSASVIVRF